MSNENSQNKKFDLKELPGKAMHKIKTFNWKEWAKDNIFSLIAIGGLVLLLILFSFLPQIMRGPRVTFWRPTVLSAYVEQVTVYLILALGACFVYLMGSMDISVGYQVSVFATIFIIIVNAIGTAGAIPLALLVIVALGLVCAVFNAFVGAYVKLPTVMSSVILMQLFSGLTTYLFADQELMARPINVSLQVLNETWVRVLVLVVLIAVAVYFTNYTVVGKRAKAIGSNKLAAQQAGANLLKTRIMCYGVFAIFLCVAVLFAIGRTDSFSETASASYQMDIMIMLLMGGMPLSGGFRGRVLNTVVGAFTYVLLDLGLGLCGVSAEYIFFIKATVFVVIVCLTCRKPGLLLPR